MIDEALQRAIAAAEVRLGKPLSASARQQIIDSAAEVRAAAAQENARNQRCEECSVTCSTCL